MGTVIDHAIMIPLSQQAIWSILSNIDNNPKWIADCESVSYLTSKRSGTGTRWRYRSSAGHDVVVDITAWYEGLGYEFVIVDGASYQNENRGRIRLQETPDGTIVQWTFNYELSGFLSGLRNSLSIKRHLDTDITNSLRNLYAYSRTIGEENLSVSSKSLMQDAPDVDSRLSYKPRHPSTSELDKAVKAAEANQEVKDSGESFRDESFQRPTAPEIVEPPIADDDTRPNPAIQESVPDEQPATIENVDYEQFAPPPDYQPEQSSVQSFEEPDFLDSESIEKPLSEQTSEDRDSSIELSPAERDKLLIDLQESPYQSESDDAEQEPVPDSEPITPISKIDSTPQTEPEQDTVSATTNVEDQAKSAESVAESVANIETPSTAPEEPEPDIVAPTTEPTVSEVDARDTAQVSVFHLFGLQKPSETQEMRALQLERDAEIQAILDEKKQNRSGLRLRLRRKSVKLRLPDE